MMRRLIALGLAFATLTGLKGAPSRHAGLIEAHKFRGEGGIIILDARIGSGPIMPFILDTGADPCVIDPVAARQLRIEAGAATTGRGGRGAFSSNVTAKPITITLGSEHIPCARTLIIDLSGVADIVGVHAAGLIGGTFFHGRVVHIDYDRHVLTTYRPGSYTVPRGAKIVPLKIQGNRSYLPVLLSVDGGPQGLQRYLQIDTGSLDTVDDPLLKEGKTPLRTVQNTGIGEGFTGAFGKWAEVKVGPYIFRNLDGTVPAVPIVGGGLLSRFNLTFNYDRRWLQLTPRKRAPKPK